MEVQQDLLTELEETTWYKDASTGARLLNFIIDMFFIIILVVVVQLTIFPEFNDNPASVQILTYVLYLFYYALFETASNGRTIGKLITRTKVIRQDGNEFTGKEAVLRSLCRLVPFDTISALGGNPWHDKWTKTRVVKAR